jgi:hypothetical protein
MAQYIDKSALVAEIKRLREQDYPCDTTEESNGYYDALDEITTFLDTLEVKKVDLEKEVQSWVEDNSVNGYYREDVYETAEHFFELGLKA